MRTLVVMSHAPHDLPPVQRITTARRSHSADMSVRMRNYAISMGIRTACVICVAVIDHWSRWLFVAGAVLLPYIAVLLANAGRERATSTLRAPRVPQPPTYPAEVRAVTAAREDA